MFCVCLCVSVSLHSYRVVMKSVSGYCVCHSRLFSNPVTY